MTVLTSYNRLEQAPILNDYLTWGFPIFDFEYDLTTIDTTSLKLTKEVLEGAITEEYRFYELGGYREYKTTNYFKNRFDNLFKKTLREYNPKFLMLKEMLERLDIKEFGEQQEKEIDFTDTTTKSGTNVIDRDVTATEDIDTVNVFDRTDTKTNTVDRDVTNTNVVDRDINTNDVTKNLKGSLPIDKSVDTDYKIEDVTNIDVTNTVAEDITTTDTIAEDVTINDTNVADEDSTINTDVATATNEDITTTDNTTSAIVQHNQEVLKNTHTLNEFIKLIDNYKDILQNFVSDMKYAFNLDYRMEIL